MAQLEIEDTYKPFPKQLAAHQAPVRYLLFGGALGPGKSRFLVEHIKQKMFRWPGIPILLARQHLVDLKRTTLREWEKVIDPRLYDPKYGGMHNKSLGFYQFPNGSRMYYAGMQDWESWQSSELGMIAYEEINEIPEKIIEEMDARLRWTTGQGSCEMEHCKSMPNYREHFAHPFYQNIAACNPNVSWVKRRFYDPWAANNERPNHRFIQALTKDNPLLPIDYEQTLLENHNETWVRRMLAGDWTAFEGATFGNFHRVSHVWRTEERGGLPAFSEVYGGIDWGGTTTYAHKTAATLTGRLLHSPDTLLTFWEYSKQGPASADFLNEVYRVNRQFKVKKWLAGNEQNRVFALMAEKGVTVEAADHEPGSRKAGVNWLHHLFDPREEPVGKRAERRARGVNRDPMDFAGEPRLFIHEDCTHLISGIESYHEVPESVATRGLGAITEDPVRRDDDEVDSLRYNVTGMKGGRAAVTNIELNVRHSPKEDTRSSILQRRSKWRHQRLEEVIKRWPD